MRRGILLAALVLSAAPARAEKVITETQVILCSVMTDPEQRLKCYDTAAELLGHRPPTPGTSPVTTTNGERWTVVETRSKIDDSPGAVLSLLSEDEVAGVIGTPAKLRLLVRCSENVTSMIVATESFLTEPTLVRVRLDQDAPTTHLWSISSNNKAVGLWRGAEAIPFIQKMLGRKTMVFRYQAHRGGEPTVTFNIEGLNEALPVVRKACKW